MKSWAEAHPTKLFQNPVAQAFLPVASGIPLVSFGFADHRQECLFHWNLVLKQLLTLSRDTGRGDHSSVEFRRRASADADVSERRDEIVG